MSTWNLPISDQQTQTALRTGWLGSENKKSRVLARAVADDQVVFEQIDEDLTRPNGLAPWLQAVRAYSLTATLTPCIAIGLFLFSKQVPIDFLTASLALIGVGFLQVAINVFNDIEDYRLLIDLPGTAGGSGVIQLGWWTPVELRRLAWISLKLGVIFGLPAAFRAPVVLSGIGLLACLGVLLYSAKKIGLKYHAAGDLTVLVLCGPALTVGFAMASTSQLSIPMAGVLWIGGFFGFLAAALLHVNNLQDINLDRKRGVSTLAIRLGFPRSKLLLWGLQFLAAVSIVVPVVLGQITPVALLGPVVQIAMALPWLRRIQSALGPESALLAQCRVGAAQIHLAGGVALAAGLLIGAFL